MELHAYAAESWFTAEGARLKSRRLQQAGLPDMTNWRFITLTMANRQISPYDAYLRGKARLRRFLARFRKNVGRPFKWCWKLEFHHEDGYPHWHLCLEYTQRIPAEMLPTIEAWWGLGRINIKRINARDFQYVFKYVAKGLDELPDWVVHHKGVLRVFQACRGFYTHRKLRTVEKREPRSCIVKVTLQTRMRWDACKAILIETDHRGLRRVRIVKLRMTFSALLSARGKEAIRRSVPLAAPNVVSLSQRQTQEIKYEHRIHAGLACIPRNSAAA